jgi:hypothetical protein
VIGEVLAREIGVHDSLCMRLSDHTRPALLPSCGGLLAQKLPDGCRVAASALAAMFACGPKRTSVISRAALPLCALFKQAACSQSVKGSATSKERPSVLKDGVACTLTDTC